MCLTWQNTKPKWFMMEVECVQNEKMRPVIIKATGSITESCLLDISVRVCVCVCVGQLPSCSKTCFMQYIDKPIRRSVRVR
jgi:hypothetical protein